MPASFHLQRGTSQAGPPRPGIEKPAEQKRYGVCPITVHLKFKGFKIWGKLKTNMLKKTTMNFVEEGEYETNRF
jgi:hypothetical protein